MHKNPDENETPAFVLVSYLRRMWCPLATPPWYLDAPLSPADVLESYREGRLINAPLLPALSADASSHAARIAGLMTSGWDDPLSVDIGVPSHPDRLLDLWPITDGNHRLYAAILLEHREISVSLSGCVETLDKVFSLTLSNAEEAPAP